VTGRTLENKTFEEIKLGDTASITKTLTKDDLEKFAALTGDLDPIHLDEGYAKYNSGSSPHRASGAAFWHRPFSAPSCPGRALSTYRRNSISSRPSKPGIPLL
jgi:acyl dehydratase